MKPPVPTNLDLMRMHVHALYCHDEHSRITSINDWQGAAAPRFYLGRTDAGVLWRFGTTLPVDVCEKLEALCNDEPLTPFDRPRHESSYVRILSTLSTVKQVWHGPAYWFSRGIPEADGPILINQNNAQLLSGGLRAWLPDVPHQQPLAAIVEDGRAVSVCASVRITPTAHEAGVETLESHRRKGYAVSVVSAWAMAVEMLSALPMYSTSTENTASQCVAARLGLSTYGVDFHIV